MDATDFEKRAAAPMTIGGHFSLVVSEKNELFRSGFSYQSARAALFAVLKAARPNRLHIPNHICPVVLQACKAANVPFSRYGIDEEFAPIGLSPTPGDTVLLVNYFGLSGEKVHQFVSELGSYRVIVDCAQAFFAPSCGALATIYSPRKFLPIPDGGLAVTTLSLEQEAADEEASLRRAASLLKRVGAEPEFSRKDYLEAEASLSTINLSSMSTLSVGLGRAINLEFISERRRNNFQTLARSFGALNRLTVKLGDQVPLCYPLLVDGAKVIRQKLTKLRIFLPIYWPNSDARTEFELQLMSNTLYLPVDHRYNATVMEQMSNLIQQLLEGDDLCT